MQYEEFGWYSHRLNRWMNIKIYGHYGEAVIAFPCQDKDSSDFSNYGMIDALSGLIESGRMKLFCVDSNDSDTISSSSWDKGNRAWLLDQYHHYIVEELLPFIYLKQGNFTRPLLVGASMGGTHAGINFFRRPDLFRGFISLSGSFDIRNFFDGYVDNNVYNNCPNLFLENLDINHPYINLYNERTMVVVVGDGAYEYLVKYTNERLAQIAYQKGINIWFNFWDQNSIHDWPSWLYQMPYFLNQILD